MNSVARRIHQLILQIAALHGIAAGAAMLLAPSLWLREAGISASAPVHPFQEIGVVYAIFGIGYWLASGDPLRHWPVLLTGLLSKILLPAHFLQSAMRGDWTMTSAAILFFGEMIWWFPLAWILYGASRVHLSRKRSNSPAVQIMALRATTQYGTALADLSELSPIMLVFLRHTGCTFCRETLADLGRQRRAIESLDTRIVLVHMSEPQHVQSMLTDRGLAGIDCVADPGSSLTIPSSSTITARMPPL